MEETKNNTVKHQKPRALLCAGLAAALAAGCVPAVAFAQATSSSQVLAAAQATTNTSLHNQVLAGNVVRPATHGIFDSLSSPATDNWVQTAYERNGKVVVEIECSVTDFNQWTSTELSDLQPDIVIARDYETNIFWEIEAKWYISDACGEHSLEPANGSIKSVKVDGITPCELDSSNFPYIYGNHGRQPLSVSDDAWWDDDDNYLGGEAGTLVIGKNVTSLGDFWASHLASNFNKVVFEKGSQLQHVGNSCGLGGSSVTEIEGLPSSAKLDDHAFGIPGLNKVTDENGHNLKADSNVWAQEGVKKGYTFPPAAPDYWKQQLKKVKSISLSVKAKKGGKSAFAKIYNVTYKKSKMTALKGSKYKKASKAQAKKIIVSKAGKVTVKKGLKPGTYKVSVKSACKGHYKTVTATVKVK